MRRGEQEKSGQTEELTVTTEEAKNLIHSGNQSFVDEEYAEAIEAYGKTIASAGQDEATARSNRAAAYLKLNKHREALQDASVALKFMPTEISFYRKGIASFALEEFETALKAFRQGQQMVVSTGKATVSLEDRRKYRTWIRKCEAEIEAEEETNKSDEDNITAEREGETKISNGVVDRSNEGKDEATAATNRAPVSSAPLPLRSKFQYYQNSREVTIAVLEKGLKETDVKVTVAPRRLTVRRTADDVVLLDKLLYEDVLPDKGRTKYLSSKVEVILTKKSPVEWPTLEGKGAVSHTSAPESAEPVADQTASATAVKTPPTKLARPYSGTKDWNMVEKEVQKELDADKPEGEEALNHLFKQIYGNADEDTRRAMVKSFQTSGGTVLSTNWDEVGKADYEKDRQAPKGMEWRTWEGQKLPQKDDDDN